MPTESELRTRKRAQTERLGRARRVFKRARKVIHATLARIARLNRQISDKQGGDGAKALRYLLKYVGKTESPAGSNDAPFLAAWRKALKTLDWMRGQPWCGFACIAAWQLGAGKRLPDGVVYTPNIVSWARTGQGFKSIPASQAKPGDLVVFNFPGGSSVADHVGLARGPAKGGVIPTIEGNTSPSNSGSQANGGGVFLRTRPVGLIAVVARPT